MPSKPSECNHGERSARVVGNYHTEWYCLKCGATLGSACGHAPDEPVGGNPQPRRETEREHDARVGAEAVERFKAERLSEILAPVWAEYDRYVKYFGVYPIGLFAAVDAARAALVSDTAKEEGHG